MTTTANRPEELDRFLSSIVATDDPAARLSLLREAVTEVDQLGETLRDLRGTTIRALRDAGWTHGSIGDLLDVTPQRVSQLIR